MAMACGCGLPAFISARMLAEIVLLDEPFFSGIALLSCIYLKGANGEDRPMRFKTAADIDAFTEALGIMLYEFASAYKNGDPSFDSIGDSIEASVSHLADHAKVSVGLSDR
jgi:hypothetical protein